VWLVSTRPNAQHARFSVEPQSCKAGHGLSVIRNRVVVRDPPHPGTCLFRFAEDSPQEGSGFELSVPLRRATASELSVPPAEARRRTRCRVGVAFFDHVALTSRLARRRSAPAIEFKGPQRFTTTRRRGRLSIGSTTLPFSTSRPSGSLPLSLWTSHWDRYLTVTRLAGCGV
jgi:hypothetical protein